MPTVWFVEVYMYRRKEHLATLLYIVHTCTLTVSSLLATYTSLVYPPCRDVARYKIVGCPKGIDDKKYERNVFIIQLCLCIRLVN